MFEMAEYFGFSVNMFSDVKDSKNGSPEILKLVPNCQQNFLSKFLIFFVTSSLKILRS